MKKGFFLPLFFLLLSTAAFSSKLTGINFQQKGEVSELELLFDENNVDVKKFHHVEGKQIIVDIKNATSTERVMRAFDTSEFSGSVVFVSAYKKENSPGDIRVAVQLRDNVRSAIVRRENRVVLQIENRFGAFSHLKAEQGITVEEKIAKVEPQSSKFNVPKSDEIVDILENLTLSGRKKYIGKKISINVKDVSVEDILKMIADASGFNIIITKEVRELPKLSLNLANIPWDQALDTILNLNKLVARKNGVILMVTTLEKETADKKLEASAKKVAEKEEPLVTKVFLISYAKIKDLNKILQEYLTPTRGKISLDERTNSIIVKDTPEIIEKMRKIIVALDTQTPQVLIESKIVEVSETYAKEIGLKNGLNFGYDPIGSSGPIKSEVGSDSFESGTDAGPGFSMSTAASGASTGTFFGFAVKRFNRLVNLDFKLQLMENESKAKIISSPKVITQNKQKAVLKTKDTTSFVKTIGSGEDAQQTFEEATAELVLEVTPQVTNEGSISLDISVSKEQFGARPTENPNAPPNKQSRAVSTNVLVDNGATVVLGGIYSFEKRESHTGVPFLKDIPLIGWLFRTPYNPSTSKNEMIIFLTPRIVNQEEAGFVDNT